MVVVAPLFFGFKGWQLKSRERSEAVRALSEPPGSVWQMVKIAVRETARYVFQRISEVLWTSPCGALLGTLMRCSERRLVSC